MIQVDITHNTQVRERFATACHLIQVKIIALQVRNDQTSLKLQSLLERNKAFRETYHDSL
ncbi:hypothetical protein SAMN05216167_11264 [Spirosoma endophyticum]|uniref:Uncharacterized protein n=1 Tax=Spirosoma endophyticum TaxID=662367 RepID=A0A1I1ZBP6_9BACT|nr:hypothetical protein SAMN05216167_11264 [Spirosoma endophyticum]